jgi:hypothetical protein
LGKDGDIEIKAVQVRSKQLALQGKVAFMASTSVDHDRYEKLIEVDVAPDGYSVEFPSESPGGETVLDSDVATDELGTSLFAGLQTSATTDTDISAFKKY